MIRNRFLILAVASTVLYLALHLLLNDVFLYAIGGALGIVVRLFSKQTNVPLLIFLWILLLGAATLFYYKFKSRPIKYFFLLLVTVLMYVVDFILYDIMSFDTTDRTIILLNVTVMVLIKSLVLSLIIYFEKRPNRLVNT
jgi:hypothetical protein